MAWNRSVPNIDNVNKTTKKRYVWRWLALGVFAVAVVTVIVLSFQKTAVVNPNDVKWRYQVVDGGIILGTNDESAVPKEISGALIIPEIIDGKPVRSIAKGAFSHCSGLKSVTIPSGVTNIGWGAFESCSGLTSVTIPSTVTNIGGRVFSDCEELISVSVDLNNHSYSSRNRLLYSKDGATLIAGVNGDVTIPESVTNILDWAFEGRSALTSVTIPSTVVRIGRSVFSGCKRLKVFSVDSDNHSYSARNGMLCSKDGATLIAGVNGEVTIPECVTNILDCAFKGRSALTSVTIPSRVLSIGWGVFERCSNLKTVMLPERLTRIDDWAFEGCSRISSVMIPSNVKSIGFGAFRSCIGLKSFIVDEANKSYRSINGLLCSKDGKILHCGVNREDVKIPETVTSIEQYAFYGCNEIKSMTIPRNVVKIGHKAFSHCSGLTSFSVDPDNPAYCSNGGLLCSRDQRILISGVNGEVAIPLNVTRIEDGAFCGCGELTSVSVMDPVLVESIGDWAFCDCSKLKLVTIPSSVTNIGIQAFRDCCKLTSVEIEIPENVENIGNWAFKGTPFYDTMPDGMVILGGGVLYAYKGNCPSELTIPDNVKRIGYGVFEGCGGLVSVTISEGVREIGTRAFKDCVGLKSVTIPSNEFTIGCERIGYEAFAGCSGLTSLALPEGVVSIGQRAFKGCVGIKSLTIPSTVTSIESGAFAGCRDLRAVTIPASLKALDSTWPWRRAWERQFQDCCEISVTIQPGKTRSVVESLLNGYGWVKSVAISEGVTNIGHHAFYGCREMTSVTIPSSVMSIGHNAFSGCGKLTSVTIPEGVISIEGAFCGCNALTSVTLPSSVTNVNGFAHCRALTSVTIPEGVTSIGDCAFLDCIGLTSVTIPSSVTKVGNAAFKGCSGLTSLMIPDSVTNVNPRAFVECTNLKTVGIVKDGQVDMVSVDEFCKRWKLQLSPFGMRHALGGGLLRERRRLQLQKEAAASKENAKPASQSEAEVEKARRKTECAE